MNPTWIACLAWLAVVPARASDEVVARAYVPNRWLPQGEVRLVRRDDAVAVQTVLLTRFETRVERYILEQEEANWPEHPDAEAYARALRDAVAEYRDRRDEVGREVGLVIDFVQEGEATEVRFGFASVRRTGDGFAVDAVSPWSRLDPTDDYVRRNQELILEDAFADRAGEVLDRLRADRAWIGSGPGR